MSEPTNALIASEKNLPAKRRNRKPPGRKPGVKQTRVPRIDLPDGDYLEPRPNFAAGLGLTDRAVRSLPLSTTYLGGLAYVPHNASLLVVLKVKTRHPPEEQTKVRGRRRR